MDRWQRRRRFLFETLVMRTPNRSLHVLSPKMGQQTSRTAGVQACPRVVGPTADAVGAGEAVDVAELLVAALGRIPRPLIRDHLSIVHHRLNDRPLFLKHHSKGATDFEEFGRSCCHVSFNWRRWIKKCPGYMVPFSACRSQQTIPIEFMYSP